MTTKVFLCEDRFHMNFPPVNNFLPQGPECFFNLMQRTRDELKQSNRKHHSNKLQDMATTTMNIA